MRTFIQSKSTEETSLDNIKAEISNESYVKKYEIVTLRWRRNKYLRQKASTMENQPGSTETKVQLIVV